MRLLRLRFVVGWAVTLLFLVIVPSAAAHNGAVAIAEPINGITVDGELSDWPGGMQRYPIELVEYGAAPDGPQDCRAWFRLGYNAQESALYVAVEVEDQSSVIDTTTAWDTQDGCDVYVQARHDDQQTGATQYATWGTRVLRLGASAHDFTVQTRPTAAGRQYEWRIALTGTGDEPVLTRMPATVGFDVAVADKDQDGSFTWLAWGKGTAKVGRADRSGDAIVSGGALLGSLQGAVRWEDEEEGVSLGRVQVHSLAADSLRVTLVPDPGGRYAVELPVGRYSVDAGYRRRMVRALAEVQQGAAAQVQELRFPRPPVGVSAKVGQGKLAVAGAGSRQGAWCTFDVSDGLPTAFIRAAVQDSAGNLWLAMDGGICRYDGHGFTTYTGTDGLAQNTAYTAFQDRDGNLWFGTNAGACRFDGRQWTTFDAQDGIADDRVLAISQDRDGNLWFGTETGVSRYDGRRIKTFDASTGLGLFVRSIVQDREGSLWFGTTNGVSRYDGQAFRTYTVRDGLAPGQVRCALRDREGNLWFGSDGGASRYDGRRFTALAARDGLPSGGVVSMLQDRDGHLWFGAHQSVSRYDGRGFRTLTAQDGLASARVASILQDREGALWFCTEGGGLSRYNGGQLTTFTARDGLSSGEVWIVLEDRDGDLWFGTSQGVSRYTGRDEVFIRAPGSPEAPVTAVLQDPQGTVWVGTYGGGVSRFDGTRFRTFTTKDGLANNQVRSLLLDHTGNLWVGLDEYGVARYDGHRFENYGVTEGLGSEYVRSMLEDRQGNLWVSTQQAGVSRNDGTRFRALTTADGLAGGWVMAILQDHDGHLWFGTEGGLSRYDGLRFTSYTTRDGLAGTMVGSILQDRAGDLWLGTSAGVSRYDGQRLRPVPLPDSPVGSGVVSIFQDREGHLWFCTAGGVVRYDGQVAQTLQKDDGLAANGVTSVFQDRRGNYWFCTAAGVTRFRPPPPSPPAVQVDAVVAGQRYEGTRQVMVPSSVELVAFEYHGVSLKTRPGAMVYRYRLRGYDEEWRNTHERRLEFAGLPVGKYTFEVRAVDRDLTPSLEPARVTLIVHYPTGTAALKGGLGLALAGLAVGLAYAAAQRRRRYQAQKELLAAQGRLMDEMQKELRTAHDLQMGLMPAAAPSVAGCTSAGRCLPASHVGGDFFQYYHADGRFSIALADITGHAMEAAIPAVMFNGILDTEMRGGVALADLLPRLNAVLCDKLTGRTHVALTLVELEPNSGILRSVNAGCPYPCHYRQATGELVELCQDAYPLGVRPGTPYPVLETRLEPGDCLVLYSDGIAEAADPTGELFGFERTLETVQAACRQGLAPDGVIDLLMTAVRTFAGSASQADDITCVVVKRELPQQHRDRGAA